MAKKKSNQQWSTPLDDLSQQEEQQQFPPHEEEADAASGVADEGQEIEEDNLVPIVLVKSVTITQDHEGGDNGRDNDNGTEAESSVHSMKRRSCDESDSAAAVAAGSRPWRSRSLCQSRRNKLVAVLAAVALVVIVALSAGFGAKMRLNKKNSGGEAGVSAAMAAVDETEEEDNTVEPEPTPSPTPYPTTTPPVLILPVVLPMAESVSNDFPDPDIVV
eukprot:CAMPEP_0172550926 /NCGR_PEP_ID=MMETSP1067-20121228/33846_1 /TAXON_ID=265564 ORGANISM="Thalassiosira punctigera, Strain Tpunct2005C2" /NCGR_SAMPLE_ID=MMETSP1067 /ASSEMBLY_ACC=CAM_ASM_000444 /LENGTH=217 /DNA_ID=CAMNT_0013338621 /DNA_START=35 /DNA_END=689 /DNA_ORIENTATION=+